MVINCLECENHNVIRDPDPHDWFCDDDMAIVCTKAHNPDRKHDSKYASDRNPYRCVTVSCRPYHLSKEAEIPSWCPLGYGPKEVV